MLATYFCNKCSSSRLFLNFSPSPTGFGLSPGTLYNPIGDAYLQIYNNVIEKINTQLDPQEMVILKKEIKDLKAKKGY